MRIIIWTIFPLIGMAFAIHQFTHSEQVSNSYKSPDCYVYISVSKEKKIAVFQLDPRKEVLLFKENVPLSGEPGSLCIDPSKTYLYSALRSTNGIAGFRINLNTGSLTHICDTPVADNPVYISTDKTGKFLYFTSYSGNKTAVYPLDNGSVNPVPVYLSEARENPHMIMSDPSGRYVFVSNLGGNVVQEYVLQNNGILEPNNPSEISVKSQSGPRHFIFHPIKYIMYLVNEKACTIDAFHFDSINGTLSGPFQEISTLPENFTLSNTCADIHITPNGMFLYASNRGHNSLAAFSVDPGNGRLTPAGHFPTEKTPREFDIDPSGTYIIAAGEGSGRIALYRILENGSLLLLSTYEVGQWPVWVSIVKSEP